MFCDNNGDRVTGSPESTRPFCMLTCLHARNNYFNACKFEHNCSYRAVRNVRHNTARIRDKGNSLRLGKEKNICVESHTSMTAIMRQSTLAPDIIRTAPATRLRRTLVVGFRKIPQAKRKNVTRKHSHTSRW